MKPPTDTETLSAPDLEESAAAANPVAGIDQTRGATVEPAAQRSSPEPAVLILVNETGTVDTVKATFTPTSVGDNLLMTNALSVAKTWKFRPAEKDGHPVKYQVIMPLSVF